MERTILLACTSCGRTVRVPDPGQNTLYACKDCRREISYQCSCGDAYLLRGEKDHILNRDELTAGRHKNNDICIARPGLSRQHCRFLRTRQGYAIEDLGSSNGTFVNGARLGKEQRVLLKGGDLLRLADVLLRYTEPEGGSSQAAGKGEGVEAQRDPLVGQRLGGYQIVRRLAQGGMGCVYVALQTVLQRECVVKTILPELATEPGLIKRFLREVRLGAKISHPNVIGFYDAGEEKRLIYLAMEYFPAENLATLFSARQAGIGETADIGSQILAGLAASHSRRILHRDLKPANILRNAEGALKILDFGLAKALGDPQFSALTAQGQAIGTPAYMAPEQVADSSTVDQRADLYAVGAVLYYCLTSRPPYCGKAFEILKAVGRKPVPPPSLYRGDVPPALERVVLKAMAAEPDARHQSAAEFYEALKGVVP